MSQESKETKKTAGQRINNLEQTLVGTLKALGALDNEQQVIKEAIGLLGNKIDAVVKLLNASKELSNDNIASVMVDNKAAKLAENTNNLVKNGVLVQTDSVDNNSFVVGREVMDDGVVINPRIQFTVESSQDNLKTKLLGAKVLDKILVQEGKAQLEILEIYSINEPKAPQAPTAQETTQAPVTQAQAQA